MIVRLQLSFDWLVLSLPLSLSLSRSLLLRLAFHWLTEGLSLSSSGRVLALCSLLVQLWSIILSFKGLIEGWGGGGEGGFAVTTRSLGPNAWWRS